MKILALRLAEVGPFREAVAIEDFSGGLDVLTGPNELGKSTLFTALRTLLSERHTTTSQKVATLRPEAGGAPLIEADVEIDGRLLRLRKRFLAQRMAVLQDLGSGEIWHGADAETAAEALLGGGDGDALRGLLWVVQGESFELPRKPDASLAGALAALIEHEAADTVGAGSARRLAEAVRARLETLVTLKQGRAKAGGALDAARRRREDIARELETARTKAAAAQERLQRHAALRAERERTADSGLATELVAKARAARSAIEEADKARERLRLFDERVAARQLANDRAKSDLDHHEQRRAELQHVATTLAASASRLETLRGDRSELEERIASVGAEIAADEASHRATGHALQAAREAQRRATALAELTGIEKRLATARAAADAISKAAEHLKSNAATNARIEAARRTSARLESLDARMDAQATWASVAYLPEAPSRLRIDGRELSDDTRIRIDGPTEIVIEGIGTITLTTGLSDGPSLVEQRGVCSAELAAALSAIGASSLADAERQSVARQQTEALMGEARAQLTALAPAGMGTLEKERDAVAARAGETHASAPPSNGEIDVLMQRTGSLEAELARKRAAAQTLDRQLRELSVTIGQVETQIAAATQRRSELEAELPAADQRESRASELREAFALASSELGAAVRERSAWAEAAPTPAAYDELLEAEARARSEAARLAERSAVLDRNLAELEGALRRDGEEGVGAEIAGLEEALEGAEARVTDLETDVAALTLLSTRLENAGTDHRELVLRPLVERLAPLLSPLLPGSSITMNGPLLAVRLDRSDRTDPLARVSGGTREQIATLVRLAYADMMASRGSPMPLVLDDALAFSDDTRLGIMVGLLADAARRHQVIVLSCHQRALAPLVEAHGARKLHVVPWHEASATRDRLVSARPAD